MNLFAPKSRARRTLRSIAVVGVMAVIAALFSLAGGSAAAFADSDSASVSGTVTDASTSLPIANVSVQINSADYSYFTSTNTASDGTYSFTGLPAGSYTLQFNAPDGSNYVQQCWSDVPCIGGTPTYFAVADGQALTGYDAQLVPGATISGTVYGADNPGVGLAGISILATSTSGGTVGFGNTDQNGDYSIPNLAPGTYQVQFQASGDYLSQWWNDQPTQATAANVTVAEAGSVNDINATLAVGSTITGTVTDSSGNPVQGVNINAQSATGSGFATTDANGDYSIAGLTPGEYQVSFQPTQGNLIAQYWNDQPTQQTANSIDVGSGVTVPDIDAQLATGATISGTVSTSAGPLVGATVAAISTSGTQITGAEPTTDANGNYTISGLPNGSYDVEFYAPFGQNLANDFWNNATSLAAATPVSVTAASPATGINATMVPGATISGTIYAPGTSKAGMANADVNIYSTATGEQIGGSATDQNGNYSVPALDPGTYSVQVTTAYNSGVVAQEWWGGTFIQTGAKTLTITQGQTRNNINVQLIVGSPISGTVMTGGASPAPAANVNVNIWPSDQYFTGSNGTPFEAETDASGNYTLPNVGPGKYTIQFLPDLPNYAAQWWNDKPTQAKATWVVVKKNIAVTGINATLAPVIITPGTPTVTGKARVGQTLTAHPGKWKPSGIIFTYQWLADGQPISNATLTTYVPTAAQVGDTISVAVTGTTVAYEEQGLSQTVDSAATAAVKAAAG